MNEPNKMYILGYNDGVERAAQQCRFYAEREDDWKVTKILDEVEQLVLMLQMSSFRRQDTPEEVSKALDRVMDKVIKNG